MKDRIHLAIELSPIIGFSLLPLFFDLSYQINLYMIWEGAYRLSLGELPYRDFGIPMGVCSWIIPALFFKVFGPSLFTLTKVQACMNIMSGLSFRWILLSMGATFTTRFLSILVFSLTFILGLYWPQYNHTVIIFQLVALGFLFHYFTRYANQNSILFLIVSAFFFSVALFTKQDAGGLAFLIGFVLVSFHSLHMRSAKPAMVYLISFTCFSLLFVLPFLQYDFVYWFNYGQPPHYSRISLLDFLRVIMEESRWEKFYLLTVVVIFYLKWKNGSLSRENTLVHFLILGILAEALMFQVTSYVPKDNNIFFHAFFCSFILLQFQQYTWYQARPVFFILLVFLSIWWSEKYWKYADKFLTSTLSASRGVSNSNISITTYILPTPDCNLYSDLSTWKNSSLKSFRRVRMPENTTKGLERVLKLTNTLKSGKGPVVLNMSELTPLIHEAGLIPEKGPLWFHLGVGMFYRELEQYKARINDQHYDIVLFEHIPTLNNFFPFAVRERLLQEYHLVDTFEAPRIVYPGTIEVYVSRKSHALLFPEEQTKP